MRWAGAVVCEPRYVEDILRGIEGDGLTTNFTRRLDNEARLRPGRRAHHAHRVPLRPLVDPDRSAGLREVPAREDRAGHRPYPGAPDRMWSPSMYTLA